MRYLLSVTCLFFCIVRGSPQQLHALRSLRDPHILDMILSTTKLWLDSCHALWSVIAACLFEFPPSSVNNRQLSLYLR